MHTSVCVCVCVCVCMCVWVWVCGCVGVGVGVGVVCGCSLCIHALICIQLCNCMACGLHCPTEYSSLNLLDSALVSAEFLPYSLCLLNPSFLFPTLPAWVVCYTAH